MRYVSGWKLDTLLHEQAKAGTVGEFLEPGGWNKSGIVQCEDMAPKITGTERTVFAYGKAVLCSNIHQRSL